MSSRRTGVANDDAAYTRLSLIVLLNRKVAGCDGFDEMNADWRQRPFPIARGHPAAIGAYSLFSNGSNIYSQDVNDIWSP
jgi:hypothetical protein